MVADPSATVSVAALTRRLAETPSVLIEGAASGEDVVVAAVLGDVLERFGHDPLDERWVQALDPAQAGGDGHHRAWQRACGVVAWLLADDDLGPRVTTMQVLALLGEPLRDLTRHVPVTDLVTDGDRREELVRLLLREADLTPDGETLAQAADRLATLDTASRLRVIEQVRAAEEHARQVREALEQQRAREAAAKAMRE